MLSSRKWNDGRHWRRFAALFSCSFLIICFLIHKAKGESSMLCGQVVKLKYEREHICEALEIWAFFVFGVCS